MTENNKTKHSPTPWRVSSYERCDRIMAANVWDAEDNCVCETFPNSGMAIDNAEFILEAVNSRERLVAELVRLRELVRRMIRPTETALSFAVKEGEIVKRICGIEEAARQVDACIAALQDLLAEARAALGEEAGE